VKFKTKFIIKKYNIGFLLHYTMSNNEQCLYVQYRNYKKIH